METCELCGSGYKLQHHHLTYVPEKIMLLCYPCHVALHMLAKIPKEKRIVATQVMLSLIETYGSHWNNGTADYVKSQYKKERYKEWRQDNKDYMKEYNKEYSKEWHQKNKEYVKKYMKQWRETNKGYDKIYYWKNKERISNYRKQRYQNNKEKVREYNKKAYKKRTLKALSNV